MASDGWRLAGLDRVLEFYGFTSAMIAAAVTAATSASAASLAAAASASVLSGVLAYFISFGRLPDLDAARVRSISPASRSGK